MFHYIMFFWLAYCNLALFLNQLYYTMKFIIHDDTRSHKKCTGKFPKDNLGQVLFYLAKRFQRKIFCKSKWTTTTTTDYYNKDRPWMLRDAKTSLGFFGQGELKQLVMHNKVKMYSLHHKGKCLTVHYT